MQEVRPPRGCRDHSDDAGFVMRIEARVSALYIHEPRARAMGSLMFAASPPDLSCVASGRFAQQAAAAGGAGSRRLLRGVPPSMTEVTIIIELECQSRSSKLLNRCEPRLLNRA